MTSVEQFRKYVPCIVVNVGILVGQFLPYHMGDANRWIGLLDIYIFLTALGVEQKILFLELQLRRDIRFFVMVPLISVKRLWLNNYFSARSLPTIVNKIISSRKPDFILWYYVTTVTERSAQFNSLRLSLFCGLTSLLLFAFVRDGHIYRQQLSVFCHLRLHV